MLYSFFRDSDLTTRNSLLTNIPASKLMLASSVGNSQAHLNRQRTVWFFIAKCLLERLLGKEVAG